jgi:hypothetical protein
MGPRCGMPRPTSDMPASVSGLPERCQEKSANLCWPSHKLGASSHEKHNGVRNYPSRKVSWSLSVVIRPTHGLRQLSPLPSQIQPLIAKLAIGDVGCSTLAFLCSV